MIEPLQTILWVAIGIVLLALVYPLQRDWRKGGNFRPRQREAFCAHCIHRDGEDCTNPKSSVYPGPIGDVCSGKILCKVIEVGDYPGPAQGSHPEMWLPQHSATF